MKKSLLFTLLLVSGCGSVATQAPPPSAVAAPPSQASLFSSDASVLSDAEIRQILATKIEVPDPLRIALLYLNHRSGRPVASGAFSVQTQAQTELPLLDESIQSLLRLPRVYDVSYLPTFLLPADRSIGLVREAAARYQADWVLVFKTETQRSSKLKLFGAEEARAQCIAECALLDVRTGIIPFTSRASEQLTVQEKEGEWSLGQTIARAEAAAIGSAMSENVENLIAFIGKVSGK